ncbi:hypothetical protein JCM10914A_52790 [Paenibacillus sp. JCM 10914]|uniref:hypothetical protein n=1 Tax=Paenibacillus sp. JCM 10914 TaxID=1236974 RepID=UPI0003CCA9B4|nr:hypothetical protein [Paenibacillus sp. JCM 10914]GAE05002.1 hypothetical protein JCM10914_1084 [Paenibacillus sp. JCM 10914]
MNDKQKRFKYIMIIIGVVGVFGTVIPNLLNTEYSAGEKAVVCLTYLIAVPIVVWVVHWIGHKWLRS